MLKLVSRNTNALVPLDELKAHLRVTWDTEDDLINSYIAAAVDYCERECQRDFAVTTWDLVIDSFPDTIDLPKFPVRSVTSITYYDEDDTQQTLDVADYFLLNPTNAPAWIQPTDIFPGTFIRPDAVTVRFATGYLSLPPVATHAIKLLVGSWYENRQEEIPEVKTIARLSLGVQSLLGQLQPGGYF